MAGLDKKAMLPIRDIKPTDNLQVNGYKEKGGG